MSCFPNFPRRQASIELRKRTIDGRHEHGRTGPAGGFDFGEYRTETLSWSSRRLGGELGLPRFAAAQARDVWDAGQIAHLIPTFPDQDSLGGLQTDLDSRVLGADGAPVPGLYAAGEVADFGGGGVHGYSALEGTFLGGCIFSGRAAGRDAAKQAK